MVKSKGNAAELELADNLWAIESLHPEKQEVTRELRAKGNEGARGWENFSATRGSCVLSPLVSLASRNA